MPAKKAKKAAPAEGPLSARARLERLRAEIGDLELPSLDDEEATVPRSARAQSTSGRRRRPLILDREDPFVIVESLDATGGVDGVTKPMTTLAMAAFREFCLLPPPARGLKGLQLELERRWQGARVPAYDTLQEWHETFRWEALVREYDSALSRLRWHDQEQERREMDDRQAKVGRRLQDLASQQAARIIAEYNAGAQVLHDERGRVLYNQRTGKPALGPKPTLAGIQGLAVLYKIGAETERVAQGAPTSITAGSLDTNVSGSVTTNVTGTVQLSLDEWRQKTALERLTAGPPPSSTALHGVRALPAPGAGTGGLTPDQLARLADDDLASLPDDWIEAASPSPARERGRKPRYRAGEQIVDADPNPDPVVEALLADDNDENPDNDQQD